MPKNNEFIPTESEEQSMLFEWAERASGIYPELALMFHIPNGSYKSAAMASKFHREGLKSGVPDILLPVPRNDYHGLFIEMKRTKGGVISENQKWWIENLKEQGYNAVICRGFEEAVAEIESYLR